MGGCNEGCVKNAKKNGLEARGMARQEDGGEVANALARADCGSEESDSTRPHSCKVTAARSKGSEG